MKVLQCILYSNTFAARLHVFTGTLSKASARGLREELLAVEAEMDQQASADDEYISTQSEYAEYAELVLDEYVLTCASFCCELCKN